MILLKFYLKIPLYTLSKYIKNSGGGSFTIRVLPLAENGFERCINPTPIGFDEVRRKPVFNRNTGKRIYLECKSYLIKCKNYPIPCVKIYLFQYFNGKLLKNRVSEYDAKKLLDKKWEGVKIYKP